MPEGPLFRLFFLIQDVIEKNSHYCAGKGCYDEHPNLSESFGGAVIDSGGYRGGDGAGGVNAGSGQVDTDEVYERQGKTDDETGFLACYGLLVGDVKNNVHEDASKDYLGDKSADDAACGEFAREAYCVVTSVAGRDNASHLEDAEYEYCADETAEDLSDNVDDEVFYAHTLSK